MLKIKDSVEVVGLFPPLEPWKLIGQLLMEFLLLHCFLNNNLLIAQEILIILDAMEDFLLKLLNTFSIMVGLILRKVILMKVWMENADLVKKPSGLPSKEVFITLLSKMKMNFSK